MAAVDYVLSMTPVQSRVFEDHRMRSVITRSATYLSTNWWTTKGYPATALPTIVQDEVGIRGAGMAAFTMAVARRMSVLDSAYASFDSSAIGNKAARLVAAVAHKHRTNEATGGWPQYDATRDQRWQSALWAFWAGLAGWMMWDTDLPYAADHAAVANMVEWEANQIKGRPAEFWRNPDGSVYTNGVTYSNGKIDRTNNTAMEEDSWNATILALASAMMPRHPNAPAWRSKMCRLLMAANATPEDTTDFGSLNGHTVAEWVSGGYNINSNFTVINHNRIHPDYMACAYHAWYAASVLALANMSITEPVANRVGEILNTMRRGSFGVKTILTPWSWQNYYPDGNDWGTDRATTFAAFTTS